MHCLCGPTTDDERRPIYYSWKDVIVETIAVRYSPDEDGLVTFSTFGGGMRIGEERLHDFNESFLGIPKDAVSKRRFDLDKLRDLCFGRFAERLYMLRFSHPSGDEYRSIDQALFQSRRYIDPGATRFCEVRDDAMVKIESFDSDISVAAADLSVPADVRFKIRGTSGALRLCFPKVIFKAQGKTFEEQVHLSYKLVDDTVRSILDADYYACKRLSQPDLEKELLFPELVDTSTYRDVLRNGKAVNDFFAALSLASPKQQWLPHLRALDELLADEDFAARVGGETRLLSLVTQLKPRVSSEPVLRIRACAESATWPRPCFARHFKGCQLKSAGTSRNGY